MGPDYILLTGGKNNAGDYLIKHRAMALLEKYRPDRTYLDVDGWKPFDDNLLSKVNKAKALLLTGGPSIQKDMRERIYPMVDDLSSIRIPIILFGGGWKSSRGTWKDTHTYKISDATEELLDRIAKDGFPASVRDFHTLNVLLNKGVDKAIMTGCPALYAEERSSYKLDINQNSNITFSTGVAFATSKSMKKSQASIISGLKEKYGNLTIAFHHTLDPDLFEKAYGTKDKPLLSAQIELAEWLDKIGINYVDLSGGLENMITHYQSQDVHVGYRVHAHIYMTSVNKISALIAEDGRGKALKDVLGGLVFEGFEQLKPGFRTEKKLFRKKQVKQDKFKASRDLTQDMLHHLEYEAQSNFQRIRIQFDAIEHHRETMQQFLRGLP